VWAFLVSLLVRFTSLVLLSLVLFCPVIILSVVLLLLLVILLLLELLFFIVIRGFDVAVLDIELFRFGQVDDVLHFWVELEAAFVEVVPKLN
jgi:hypothetical protein